MRNNAAWLGPLALTAAGVLLLLNNLSFGFNLAHLIRDWWPLALIGLGLWRVLQNVLLRRSFAGGLILMLVGTAFQVHRIWPEIEVGQIFRTYWPVILVVIGLSQLVVTASWRSRGRAL